MPFEDPRALAAVGLRPAGTGPSVLETIIGGAGKFVDSYLDAQDNQFKREKDKVDMYTSLRKAGYTRQQAYDAVKSKQPFSGMNFDTATEEDTLDEKKTKSEIAKNEALTNKYTQEGRLATKKLHARGAAGNQGGFSNPGDVPKEAGGLPLKNVKQDKKTGRYYGEYAQSPGGLSGIVPSSGASSQVDEDEEEDTIKKFVEPSWFSQKMEQVRQSISPALKSVFGSMQPAAGAEEVGSEGQAAPAPKVTPSTTGNLKTKKGVTFSYKRKG